MSNDFNREKPIYTQLVERICGEILREERLPGTRLPSVREYAWEVGVNVNTMQRVYKELEKMNLIETKRGQGSFITHNEKHIIDLRTIMKSNMIQQFFVDIQELGFSIDEIVHEIKVLGGDKTD